MAGLHIGFNDLGTVNPALARELVNPQDAQTVTEWSGKSLRWFCEEGHPRHEWQSVVNNRSSGKGCSVCVGRVVLFGHNDLGTVNPVLARELVNPQDAQTVPAWSSKSLLWFCETGHPRHEWWTTVNHRSNGTGCAVCAGKSVLVGHNDLATANPKLASQLVNPQEGKAVTEWSNKKLLWFCEESHPRHEWSTKVNSRSCGRGCAVCAGMAVLVGHNDLGTVNPRLSKELVNPQDAQTVTAMSGKKLLWFCETAHPRYEWRTTVNHRSRGKGCRQCARSGFDPAKPAWVYRFTFSSEEGVTGVGFGITNHLKKRMSHYRLGFKKLGLQPIQNIDSLWFKSGERAERFEKEILAEMKTRGIEPHPETMEGLKKESFVWGIDPDFDVLFEVMWGFEKEKSKSE